MKRIAAFAALVILAASASAAPYGLAVGSTWRETVSINSIVTITNVPGYKKPVVEKFTATAYSKVVGIDDVAYPDAGGALVMQSTAVARVNGRKRIDRSKVYLSVMEDGVYRLGQQDMDPPGELMDEEKPVLQAPWPLAIGKTWVERTDEMGVRGTVKYRVAGRGPVRVGKKRYENAYRVEGHSLALTAEFSLQPGYSLPVDGAALKSTTWLVPELGPVKTDVTVFAKVSLPLEDIGGPALALIAQDGGAPAEVKGTLRQTFHMELAAFAPGKEQPAKKAAQ